MKIHPFFTQLAMPMIFIEIHDMAAPAFMPFDADCPMAHFKIAAKNQMPIISIKEHCTKKQCRGQTKKFKYSYF